MKRKEIDQRLRNDLLIRCSCGSNHFLSFVFSTDLDKWDDNDEKSKIKDKKTKKYLWKDYYITFIERYEHDFWSRVRECWKYLFKKDKAEMCYTGIGITSKDMNKIIKHFKKYQSL